MGRGCIKNVSFKNKKREKILQTLLVSKMRTEVYVQWPITGMLFHSYLLCVCLSSALYTQDVHYHVCSVRRRLLYLPEQHTHGVG